MSPSHSWDWWFLSSLFFSWSIWTEISILCFFSNKQCLISLILIYRFSTFYLLIYPLIFIISFPLLTLNFIWSFSGFWLRWKLRSLIWKLSSFQIQAFSAKNSLLSKALAVFPKTLICFSFIFLQFIHFLIFLGFSPLSSELYGSMWSPQIWWIFQISFYCWYLIQLRLPEKVYFTFLFERYFNGIEF